MRYFLILICIIISIDIKAQKFEIIEVKYIYNFNQNEVLNKYKSPKTVEIIYGLYFDTSFTSKSVMSLENYEKYYKYDTISLAFGYNNHNISYRLLTKKSDTLSYKDLVDKGFTVNCRKNYKLKTIKEKIIKEKIQKCLYIINIPLEWQIYNSNLKQGDDNPIEFILLEIYKMEDHWLEKEIYNKTLIKTFKIPFTN